MLLVEKLNLFVRQLEAFFRYMTDWGEKKMSHLLRNWLEFSHVESLKPHSALTLKVQGSEKVINSTPTGVSLSLSPFSHTSLSQNPPGII